MAAETEVLNGSIFWGNNFWGARKKGTTKNFVCHVCQRRFAKSYNLMIHERSHKENLTFRCDFCGKFFHKQENLKDHQ